MSALPERKLTPEEYLAIEETAQTRSEFFDGVMYSMAGGTIEHNAIAMNVGAELHARFKSRPCRAFVENMRVKINAAGDYTYPDVVALCAPPQFADTARTTLTNPELIVEVFSSSTERYDQERKLLYYQDLASLTQYVLLEQNVPLAKSYVRNPDGVWTVHFSQGLDATLGLPTVGCALPLAEIYAKVQFPTAPARDTNAGA